MYTRLYINVSESRREQTGVTVRTCVCMRVLLCERRPPLLCLLCVLTLTGDLASLSLLPYLLSISISCFHLSLFPFFLM